MESGGPSQRNSLYEPLPSALGGRNTRPIAAAIGNLLPYPEGSNPPPEQEVNNSIRHKVLLLNSDVKRGTSSSATAGSGKSAIANVTDGGNALKNVTGIVSKRSGSKCGRPNGKKLVIPQDERKYSIYVPLHNLWKQYASQLRYDDPEAFADRVIRMDLHGALITVVRSKDPSLIGKTGIIIAETANTVLIITKENRALTLPKNVCVISLEVDSYRVEIYLPALAFRPSERSARKIKKKHMPYI